MGLAGFWKNRPTPHYFERQIKVVTSHFDPFAKSAQKGNFHCKPLKSVWRRLIIIANSPIGNPCRYPAEVLSERKSSARRRL